MATQANVSNDEVELKPLHSHVAGKRVGERQSREADGGREAKQGDKADRDRVRQKEKTEN